MLLVVCIWSYGCTWQVWRALKKLELLSAAPRVTLTLLSCSPNFPRASITRYTHAKHELIHNKLYNFSKVIISLHTQSEMQATVFLALSVVEDSYYKPRMYPWRIQAVYILI